MPCVRSYGERSQTLQDPRTRDLTGPLIGLILVASANGLQRNHTAHGSYSFRNSYVRVVTLADLLTHLCSGKPRLDLSVVALLKLAPSRM